MRVLPGAEILVVDGSEDRTPEIARLAGATVIREPGGGFGPALHAALSEALTNFALHIVPNIVKEHDGTLIYVQNRGFAHAGSPEVQARIDAGLPIDPQDNYFRTAPVFTVAVGPHDWLSRTVFVGLGDKRADHSLFDFYAVR